MLSAANASADVPTNRLLGDAVIGRVLRCTTVVVNAGILCTADREDDCPKAPTVLAVPPVVVLDRVVGAVVGGRVVMVSIVDAHCA